METQENRVRTGETVRVRRATYKRLKGKSNDLFQDRDRRVPIAQLIEWLVDNHLDDFPMDLCAKTVTR